MLKLTNDLLCGRLLRVSPPRSICARLTLFLLVLGALHLLLTFFEVVPEYVNFDLRALGLSRGGRGTCPPDVWAKGRWVPKRAPTNKTLTDGHQAMEFVGFECCASNRETWWHLGADAEGMYDRFPGVAAWRWEPPRSCGIADVGREELVRHLVEDGGWLLIGDSVTEGHFFSLSCQLYPHVRATPDWTKGFDRGWPQNLYLDPSSPLISNLKFPPGFDIAKTPLVTFRRIDLLVEAAHLEQLYRARHPNSKYLQKEDYKWISDEPLWNMSPEEYVALFTAPRPEGNYGTMIMNTGGHWTSHLFLALKDDSMFNEGIFNIVEFFEEAMNEWAHNVQALLDRARESGTGVAERPGQPPRQVLVRAYLPGNHACHEHRMPLKKYTPPNFEWYNWNQIEDFNRAFERAVSSPQFRDIHFLPIDRPGLLRPDAHVASDCLHVMAGAGVLEGWSHYIWHYVTVELPGRIR